MFPKLSLAFPFCFFFLSLLPPPLLTSRLSFLLHFLPFFSSFFSFIHQKGLHDSGLTLTGCKRDRGETEKANTPSNLPYSFREGEKPHYYSSFHDVPPAPFILLSWGVGCRKPSVHILQGRCSTRWAVFWVHTEFVEQQLLSNWSCSVKNMSDRFSRGRCCTLRLLVSQHASVKRTWPREKKWFHFALHVQTFSFLGRPLIFLFLTFCCLSLAVSFTFQRPLNIWGT